MKPISPLVIIITGLIILMIIGFVRAASEAKMQNAGKSDAEIEAENIEGCGDKRGLGCLIDILFVFTVLGVIIYGISWGASKLLTAKLN